MSETNGKEALLVRLSYQATLRAKVLARYGNKLRDTRPINLALVLGPLWIAAHYMRQVALFKTKLDMTTILSSTSSFLTLQVAAIYPLNQRDQFTISKLVAVVFGVIGTVSLD
ncbi:hypothetical protein NQ317_006346 [Molorchus minor]|uniref:EamA domain-containing protein n=1 Tax=Molorchus minor TaxID=1323400 RepID=A0ABQ9JMH8_9CUCU|nr:hypothetical protein NQ317_006346 [Molorchus minor]